MSCYIAQCDLQTSLTWRSECSTFLTFKEAFCTPGLGRESPFSIIINSLTHVRPVFTASLPFSQAGLPG